MWCLNGVYYQNTVSHISVDNEVSWSGPNPCQHNRDRLSIIEVLNTSCNGDLWIVYTFLIYCIAGLDYIEIKAPKYF